MKKKTLLIVDDDVQFLQFVEHFVLELTLRFERVQCPQLKVS